MTLSQYVKSAPEESRIWLFDRARQLLKLHKNDYVMSVTVNDQVDVMYTKLKFKLERRDKIFPINEFFLPEV